MQYVALAMAAISAGSAIMGAIKGNKGATSKAKIQGRQELELTQAKLEDLKTEERVMKGQTIGAAAGAGVKVDKGSPLPVLKEQAKNFAKERMTVAQVGATNASVINQRGKMVGDQAKYQGFGQAASTASSAFAMFA